MVCLDSWWTGPYRASGGGRRRKGDTLDGEVTDALREGRSHSGLGRVTHGGSADGKRGGGDASLLRPVPFPAAQSAAIASVAPGTRIEAPRRTTLMSPSLIGPPSPATTRPLNWKWLRASVPVMPYAVQLPPHMK